MRIVLVNTALQAPLGFMANWFEPCLSGATLLCVAAHRGRRTDAAGAHIACVCIALNILGP